MTRTFRLLQTTGFSVAAVLSRVVLAFTIVSLAVLGLALLVIPAVAAFLTMEWARASRWFRRG